MDEITTWGVTATDCLPGMAAWCDRPRFHLQVSFLVSRADSRRGWPLTTPRATSSYKRIIAIRHSQVATATAHREQARSFQLLLLRDFWHLSIYVWQHSTPPFSLNLTRSSANADEPCEHTVSWNRVKCCTKVIDGLHLKKPTTGEWPSRSFKVTAVAVIW